MSTPQVSNLVNRQINELGIQKNDQVKVRKCVAGYSKPDSFLGKISWVAYRIFNAIKSIFGQSDWQIAKKVIMRRSEQRIPESDKAMLSKAALERGAETALKILVEQNENNLGTVLEEYIKLLGFNFGHC